MNFVQKRQNRGLVGPHILQEVSGEHARQIAASRGRRQVPVGHQECQGSPEGLLVADLRMKHGHRAECSAFQGLLDHVGHRPARAHFQEIA